MCWRALHDPEFRSALEADPAAALTSELLDDDERQLLLAGAVDDLHRRGANAYLLANLMRVGVLGLTKEAYIARMATLAVSPVTPRSATTHERRAVVTASATPSSTLAPPPLKGIDHFSIPCSDPFKSLTFYEAVLGAQVYEDDLGPYVFGVSDDDRALGRSIHIFVSIGAVNVELLGEDPEGTQPFGTHHAFAVDAAGFDAMQDHLRALGVPFWGPATHNRTKLASIYVKDPDNNQLEFTCWAGYPGRESLPLSQHMERPDPSYEWDAEARRAVAPSA